MGDSGIPRRHRVFRTAKKRGEIQDRDVEIIRCGWSFRISRILRTETGASVFDGMSAVNAEKECS